jgi:hypothetical protein
MLNWNDHRVDKSDSSSMGTTYHRLGYVIIRGLFDSNGVDNLRRKIVEIFRNNPDQRILFSREIIEKIPEVFDVQRDERLIAVLKQILGQNFQYINDFQAQKNMSRVKRATGWHDDVNSQYLLRYVNKNINYPIYRVLKVGIYLQGGKSLYGSSVDVIPRSHRMPRKARMILTRLLNHPLSAGAMSTLFSKALDKTISAGDAIVFDANLLHASSIATREGLKDLNSYRNHAFYSTPENSKLTIYFEAGDRDSCRQYLISNLVRALSEEVGDVDEKYFSDYLSILSSKYPPGYLGELRDRGIDVASLDVNLYKRIARDIYESLDD